MQPTVRRNDCSHIPFRAPRSSRPQLFQVSSVMGELDKALLILYFTSGCRDFQA